MLYLKNSISTCRFFVRLCAFMAAFLCADLAVAAVKNQSAAYKQNSAVNNVRLWRDKEYTRFVFDLNTPVKYTLSSASNPDRIYIDIRNTSINVSLDRLALARTPVSSIRSSVVSGDLRLTLELKQKVTPKSFFLKKEGGSDDRLVVDLYDAVEPEPATTAKTISPANSSPRVGAANSKLSANELNEPANIEALVSNSPAEKTADVKSKPAVNLSGKRDILITVDAGHGGQDTGALGSNGLREKDITLAIAKELVAIINSQQGFSAHVTRSNDIFIPLKTRRDIARDKKADLFVSIHADAFTNSMAKGASVFALSRKGATSETARFLAQHENESDAIGGVAGVSLDDKDAVLAGVLVDLSMTATVNSSLVVGNHVLKSIGGMAPLHGRHVEQAGFVVLKSPDVPSILVETGFISNQDESRKLATTSYRTQMAQSIFKGLRQYFMQHPPAGTLIAELQQSEKAYMSDRQHIVGRGDTLSSIAARYNVKQNQLAKHNELTSNSVKLGQTLKIPAQ